MGNIVTTFREILKRISDGVAKISGLFNLKAGELVSRSTKELEHISLLPFITICFILLSSALFIMFFGSEPFTFVYRLLSSDGKEPEIVSYLRGLEWLLIPLWQSFLSLLLYLLYVEQFKILVLLMLFCFILVSVARLIIFFAEDVDNLVYGWLVSEGNEPDFFPRIGDLEPTLRYFWSILFVFLFYACCREYYENPKLEWFRSSVRESLVAYSTPIIVIVLSLLTLVWDFVWALIEDPVIRDFFLNFYIHNYHFLNVFLLTFASLFLAWNRNRKNKK